MTGFRSPFVPGLPRFTGGAVGYLGYDAAAWFEPVRRRRRKPARPSDDEAGFMLFDTVLAFDHVQHRILIIANARITGDEDLGRCTSSPARRSSSSSASSSAALSLTRPAERAAARRSRRTSRASEFEGMVRAAKEHIAAGDIYQVVLSQRFEAEVAADRSRSIARCAT